MNRMIGPRLWQTPNRRTALTGAAAAACLPFVATASGPATPHDMHLQVADRAKSMAGHQKVMLRLLLPHGSSENVTPVINAFERLTGIEIHVQETPVDEINTELTLDALSKSQQFDIALPATFGIPDLVASKAILPLTQFAQRYEPEGFREGNLYSIGDSFDGEVYGFQTDGDAYLTFYNKAMMQDPAARDRYSERFGYPLGVPETWAELDQQMAFFHAPDQGRWGGLLFRTPGYLAWEWWVRFHGKGIWPFSPLMEPQIASEAGLAALEEMIAASQYLAPESTQLGLFENWERFSRGDIYCNIGWGGTQKYLNRPTSPMRGNLVFGPTPGGDFDGEKVTMPYFNWGWNYVVTTNAKHPEIAYLFALFASTPFMSTQAVRQPGGFFDPYREEHYSDPGIQETYSPEFLDVHRTSMQTAIPDLYLKGQGEYFRILGEWLARAIDGEVAPLTALQRAAQRWQLVTNSSGLQDQQQRWADLRAKYPACAREVLRDID